MKDQKRIVTTATICGCWRFSPRSVPAGFPCWIGPRMETNMIDHVGFPVSDYATSKAFYPRALAPLGYGLVMEVGANEMGAPRPASGSAAIRTSGSAARAGSVIRCMLRSLQRTALRSMRSTRRRSRRAARTTARRACARTMTPTTTPPSCSIPTGTTSRRYASAGVGPRGLDGPAVPARQRPAP